MRIGLTTKLLLVLGLTSAVSVMAMALAARWSFQHGFLDYLGQQELKRIEPLRDALLQAYRERGSWEFLARHPVAWPRFVDQAMAPALRGRSQHKRQSPDDHGTPSTPDNVGRGHEDRFPRRSPSPAEEGGNAHPVGDPDGNISGELDEPLSTRTRPRHRGPPGIGPPGPYDELGFGPPGPPPYGPGREPPDRGPPERRQSGPPGGPSFGPLGDRPHRPGFGPPPPPPGASQWVARVRLLDVERSEVAGMMRNTEDEILDPLVSDGVVVGWLGLSSPLWLEDELAQRFNSQHNRSLSWIALAALTLAMLLGSIFGEAILRRIRAVAAGARQLAKGNYQVRVARQGRDELTGLAEDFNHLAVALERSEELRRSAMADVSHELRTPLAVARAELDALIDGIRPCTKDRLEQLQSRLLTLGRLLDDLYDLALSDTGALDYRYEALDMAEVVQTAVGDMQASFAKKGLEVQVRIDGELPMDGDRGRLRQVIDNLLANSLRYTDPGGFSRIVAKHSGDEILITVEDTAPGVDQAALERLFDRFYRVEASRSRAKGGAGLGLAICRNIVEAHRGSISARPANSGGLAIDIRLPAHAARGHV